MTLHAVFGDEPNLAERLLHYSEQIQGNADTGNESVEA